MTSFIKRRFQRNLLSSAVVLTGGLMVSGGVSAALDYTFKNTDGIPVADGVVNGGETPYSPQYVMRWTLTPETTTGLINGYPDSHYARQSILLVADNPFIPADEPYELPSGSARVKNADHNFNDQVSIKNFQYGTIDHNVDNDTYILTPTEEILGLVDTGYGGDYVLIGDHAVELFDGDVAISGVTSIDTKGGNALVSRNLWNTQQVDGNTNISFDSSSINIELDTAVKLVFALDANEVLSTRDQYRFEGTAIVPASATLEAVLNDSHAASKAFYSAKQFDIADGATIRVDGSSADYTASTGKHTYLIVETDQLNADQSMLNLTSEGLVDVAFADAGNNQISVVATVLNLEEESLRLESIRLAEVKAEAAALAAAEADFSRHLTNVSVAAGSLQSVLETTGGTATGDAYYDLAVALRDQGSFEELSPMVENTSAASMRGADEQTASHVGGLLQSYRGGASGDTPIASGLWIQGLSSSGEQDSMGDTNGFDIDTSGYAIGYDIELAPGLTSGFAISYSDSDVKVDNSLDRQTSDGYTGALYGQYIFGNDYYSSAILSYGQNDNDSQRWVANDYADANFDSDILSLRVAGGKKIWVNSLLIQPLVEFNYSEIGIDSYTETGSVAALNVDDQDYKIVELGFGASISQDFEVGKTLLRPELKAAYYHDFQQDGVRITSAFTAGGNSFVTTGEDADANRYNVKAGLAWVLSDSNTLRASYDYNASDNYAGGTWLMDYRMDF